MKAKKTLLTKEIIQRQAMKIASDSLGLPVAFSSFTSPYMNDPFAVVCRNTDKVLAGLTDYSASKPSLIKKCVFLTECERAGLLGSWASDELAQARADIAAACGIHLPANSTRG